MEAPNKGANVKCREASLGPQAANWPTPAAHEPRLGVQNRRPGAKGTQESLTTHASRFSLQDQPTSTPGEKSFDAGPNSNLPWPSPRTGKTDKLESNVRNATGKGKKLNPLFVEWLMGLPTGMTDFAPLETPWCQQQRRWRSLLFGED